MVQPARLVIASYNDTRTFVPNTYQYQGPKPLWITQLQLLHEP